MARALAPDISIRAVEQGNPLETVQLVLEISGGSYDTIEYNWHDDTRRVQNQVFSSQSAASPTWTRPDPESGHDDWITVTCDVTVRGTGSNADNGTSDTANAVERARVFFKPNADAPSIGISSIPDGKERTTINLRALVGQTHAGNYDSLTYNWRATQRGIGINKASEQFDHTDKQNVTWTRPDVDGNTIWDISCDLTAHGNNDNALIRSTEETTISVATTVIDIPDAQPPLLVRIWHNNDNPDDESRWFHTAGSYQEHDHANIRLTYNDQTGHFDSLSYVWEFKFHDQDQNSWVTIGTDSQVIQWTVPSVAERRQYDIRCRVTAHGNDDNAAINTQSTSTIVSAEAALYINPLPNAIAPSIWIESQHPDNSWQRDAYGGIEEGTVNLQAVVDDNGLYDILSYRWTILDWNGLDITTDVLDDPDSVSVVLTRPSVTQDRYITVRCAVAAIGDDIKVNEGSIANNHHDERMFVKNHPRPVAPHIYALSGVGGRGGTTTTIAVAIDTNFPGQYDFLTYRWQISPNSNYTDDEAQEVLEDYQAASTTWTRKNLGTRNRRLYIACTVTAHGNDTNYDADHTDTFATSWVEDITPMLVASAPTGLLVIDPQDGYEDTRVTLLATNNDDGIYDVLRFTWSVNGVPVDTERHPGFPRQITVVRPNVTGDENVPISVTLEAVGTGTKARPNTTDSGGTATGTMRVIDGRNTSLLMRVIDNEMVAQDIHHAEYVDDDGYVHNLLRFLEIDQAGQATEVFSIGD